MNWLNGLQLEMAHNYAVLLGHLYDCSVFDAARILSGALLVAFLSKLIVNGIQSLRLRRHALPVEDPALLEQLAQVSRRLKLPRIPRMMFHEHHHLPAFTMGTINPWVSLSPAFSKDLSADEMDAVLAHELGHIRRRDNLISWLLDLVLVAMPLAMIGLMAGHLDMSFASCVFFAAVTLLAMILYRILLMFWFRQRCEHACDDFAIAHGTQPLALAAALVKAWRWMSGRQQPSHSLPLAQAFFPGQSCLEQRVSRLVSYRGPALTTLLEKGCRIGAFLFLCWLGLFLVQFHLLGSFDAQLETWKEQTCCMGH